MTIEKTLEERETIIPEEKPVEEKKDDGFAMKEAVYEEEADVTMEDLLEESVPSDPQPQPSQREVYVEPKIDDSFDVKETDDKMDSGFKPAVSAEPKMDFEVFNIKYDSRRIFEADFTVTSELDFEAEARVRVYVEYEEEVKLMGTVFLGNLKPGQTKTWTDEAVDAQMDRIDQDSVWELVYYTRATGTKVVRDKDIFLKRK